MECRQHRGDGIRAALTITAPLNRTETKGVHHGFVLFVARRVAAAECARIRCNDSLGRQYVAWLGRAIRLDFGDSTRFGRPVRTLIGERAANSFVLGVCALILATGIGIPAGVLTGSRPSGLSVQSARGAGNESLADQREAELQALRATTRPTTEPAPTTRTS